MRWLLLILLALCLSACDQAAAPTPTALPTTAPSLEPTVTQTIEPSATSTPLPKAVQELPLDLLEDLYLLMQEQEPVTITTEGCVNYEQEECITGFNTCPLGDCPYSMIVLPVGDKASMNSDTFNYFTSKEIAVLGDNAYYVSILSDESPSASFFMTYDERTVYYCQIQLGWTPQNGLVYRYTEAYEPIADWPISSAMASYLRDLDFYDAGSPKKTFDECTQ